MSDLPVSFLSEFCRWVANYVRDELKKAIDGNISVMIGRPGDAQPGQGDDDHRVNLFFYRFEPGGFGPGASPDEPWFLRLHMLATAFGVLQDKVSAGENELGLLGQVIRIFHETPVLDPVQVNGRQVRAQVVFQPLSVDEINHLWSTQGDTAYRPSVAYEMALVPVVPEELRLGDPLAGALGLEVRTKRDRAAPFAGIAAAPAVVVNKVDIKREDWAPRICFVEGNLCAESLVFAVGSTELGAFRPEVWVAGKPGAAVELKWEVWDKSGGWRPHGSTVATTATDLTIDPEVAANATTMAVGLPFHDHEGQAVLYAERSYTRGSDDAQLTVRSNPLLVTLYEVKP